jgi:hypothetical protein
MATKPLTLKGIVKTDESDHSDELRELRRDNQRLDEALRQVRNELGEALAQKETLERTIRALRNQLSPLHHALRAIFGEIELAVGEEEFRPVSPGAPASAPNSRDDPRWESFKQTFPGIRARIIDALLVHDAMTISQLAGLLKASYNAVKDNLPALYKAGAVIKPGGKGGAVSLNR